ncbi:hypothetical protein [Fibrobacter sp.]|uniref:hypothetical protein n=1 Tax=Fibrobacter sp. TaxID=35828 RepID=UPI002625DB98|nr:hypothetical protein [Fibrobacter sp.]MDD5943855.1 hypothetical protein [Fibrobacter sp.]
MSRQFWLGLFLFAVCAFGMNVDSLPVWDPSLLTRNNSFVRNLDTASRHDSIETHGYKTVQVTVGDGGTQVDQELRLSITGKLTDSVYVDALLSDVGRRAGDQTTATLREVDQIYFRVESPHYFLHLGDLTWVDSLMGFTGVERASLGAMGGVRGNFGGGFAQVRGVVGTDEVQHYTFTFNGVSGQQLGYSLDGAGNFIAVVPQSETVWLNGVRLTRGRDYLVNYAGGMLDFKGAVVPSFDDEIRVEYDAYENDNIYTLYGAAASYRHPNLYLDVSGFKLENDVDRLKRGVWTDEDYAMLKADRGDEFVRNDTLPPLNRPDRTERMNARVRVQHNQQFYADFELALNRSDSNIVSSQVGGPEGRAFRWFVTTDSTRDLLHFPLAMSVYGNRVQKGFDILQFRGTDLDWNLYGLRDRWDLAYADSSFLDDDLLHDELAMRSRFARDWFGSAQWGYRRNAGEDWNSSRGELGVQHRNRYALGELSLIRVSSLQERKMERYQGTANAEYLQGMVRPFGTGDLRFTKIDQEGVEDEVVYGKSSSGFGIFFDRGEIRESVGGRMAKRRGDTYGDEWADSLWASTWVQEANYNSRYFTLSHLLQYERVRTDSSESKNSWLANLDSRFGAEELGVQGNVSYKLGLTEEQIYTAVYKAVAPGTGDVRYDSLTASYIEGVDNGDFVYEGMGRNDSVGAVLSSDAEFGMELRFNPGLALGIRDGFLRDVTFGGSYEGEGSDTTDRKIYFPPVNFSQLHRMTSGRMAVEGLVDWQHPSGVSLAYKPGASFDKKLSSISYYETSYSHQFDAGYRINLDHFVGGALLVQENELSAMQEWEWDIYDGSLRYRFDFLQGFFVQPLGRYRTGEGTDGSGYEVGKFDANLWEGALRVGYHKQKKVNSYANFSVVQVDSHGDIIPYQVMAGYNDGRTYRFEFSLSVDINDFLSMGCLYILRFGDAEENIFQKLSTEARAYF